MNIKSHETDTGIINRETILLAKRAMANFLKAHERRKAAQASKATTASLGVFSQSEENAGYTLDLSNLELNDDEFIQLLPEIAKLPALRALNLERNPITGKSIEIMLCQLPRIRELNLSECHHIQKNNGCLHLAQLRYLRTLNATRTGLNSDDFDNLTVSNSLTDIGWFQNRHADPVRKGRLVASMAFNEARLLKPGSAGNDKLDEVQKEKTEFIRLNIDKYIRIALDKEKADTDFRVGMCRRQLPPNYPNFLVGKFTIK